MGRHEQPLYIPPEGDIPLGTKIRIRRRSLGMSLTDFAKLAGNYNRSYISHVEGGSGRASKDTIASLARALQFDSSEALIKADRDAVMEWVGDNLPTIKSQTLYRNQIAVARSRLVQVERRLVKLEQERIRLTKTRNELQQFIKNEVN